LALASLTGGDRSIGIVRLRTKTTEFIHLRIVTHEGNHFMASVKQKSHFLKSSNGGRGRRGSDCSGDSGSMSGKEFKGTTIAEKTIICQTQPNIQKICALFLSPSLPLQILSYMVSDLLPFPY
jgi:hypothetical protein